MANIYQAQTDFSGGEISPRMSARSDSERYQTGLSECENWIVTPQGSLRMREGTQYIGEASSPDDVRLIGFRRANKEDYVIELSAPVGGASGKVRLWDRQGKNPVTPSKVLIGLNPKLIDGFDGLEYWNPTQNTNNDISTISLTSPKPLASGGWAQILTRKSVVYQEVAHQLVFFAKAYISQEIIVPSSGQITIEFNARQPITKELPISWGDQSTVFADTSDSGSRRLKYKVTIGTTIGGDEISSQEYSNDEIDNPTIGTGKISISEVGLTPDDIIFVSISSIQDTVDIISGTIDNPIRDDTQFYSGVEVNDLRIYETGLAIPENDFETDHEWGADELAGIQYVFETARERVVLVSDNTPPHEIVINTDGSWYIAPISINVPPPSWAAGNYPRCVTIFQSRMWYASTNNDLARLWASRAGSLDNFEVDITTIDTSTIDVEVATNGVIHWMSAVANTLLIGTDIGELSVGSSTGAVTPSDIQINQSSAHGSSYIQSETIADEVMFMSDDKRKLRAISFLDSTNNWIATDLTFPSEHLTFNKVVRIENLKNPDYQIVLLLTDGTWIQCTYNRGTQTLAWHKHKMGNVGLEGKLGSNSGTVGDLTTDFGFVKSITVASTNNGSSLWMAVKRQNGIKIEFVESNETYKINLDSWISRTVGNGLEIDGANWIATGLEHLDEEIVFIIIDGSNGGYKKVENGQVVVSPVIGVNITEAIVGLPIEATAKLLPVETGDRNNAIQSAKQRRVELVLRLVDSSIPKVNGVLPPERGGASTMDIKEPNLTADAEYNVSNWSQGDSDVITQDLPFRTEIVGVFGKTTTNRI